MESTSDDSKIRSSFKKSKTGRKEVDEKWNSWLNERETSSNVKKWHRILDIKQKNWSAGK